MQVLLGSDIVEAGLARGVLLERDLANQMHVYLGSLINNTDRTKHN